jgi:hypothetical protein
MRKLAIFPILVLLLQSCMPDSFTKFEEETASKASPTAPGASGGGGGGTDITESCPLGELTPDGACASPRFLMFDPSEERIDHTVTANANERREGVISHLISDTSFGQPFDPILFIPTNAAFESYEQIFSAQYAQQIKDLTTYAIQLQTPNVVIPASINLSTDGEISGTLDEFLSPRSFLISASFNGDTKAEFNADNSNAALLELSAFNDIEPDLYVNLPASQGITLVVNTVDGIEVGDVLFTEPGNSFRVNFVNEDTNTIVGTINDNDMAIVPTVTGLFRGDNLNSRIATITSYSISLQRNQNLSINPQSGDTLFFSPISFKNDFLTREELDFYEFSVTSADGLPAGLSIAEKSVCGSPECLAGSTKNYCSSFDACSSSGFFWVIGGTIFGIPTDDSWSTPRTVTIEAQGPEILLSASCSDTTYYTQLSCLANGGVWTPTTEDLQASITINLGVTESPQRIAYEQQVGDRLRIPVSDSTPFAVGQTISKGGANSPIATIIRVRDTSLIVDVTNGGRCLQNLALNRNDCVTTPGFQWQPHLFLQGDSIDNSNPYLVNRATITGTPTHEINASDSFNLNLLVSRTNSFAYANLIPSALLADFSISTFPDLDMICGSANFVNGSLNCVTNNLSSAIEETAFSFNVVSPNGRSVSTNIPLVFQTLGEDNRITMTSEVLLKIQNPSGFVPNDFISSNNIDPGLGIVREVSSKTILGTNYDFVWVHVLSGKFAVNNNVDKAQKYFKQVGLISDAAPFSAVLNVPGPGNIASVEDYFTSGVSAVEESMVFQGATVDTASGTASVILSIINGANSKLYVALDSGQFDTASGNIKLLSNPATVVVNNITSINSKFIHVTFGAAVTANIDQNIVQTNSRTAYQGVGTVRSLPTATTAVIDKTFGLFSPAGQPIHFENPIPMTTNPAIGDSITSSRTVSNYFLGHTSQPFQLTPYIFGPSGGITYSIFPELPEDLDLSIDPQTGIISGIPTDRLNPTQFQVFTSDGRLFTFTLEIRDYFQVTLSSVYSSYVLHESGMGKNTAPCRVSRETMANANPDSKDIICFVEAGESELFYKGLDLEVSMGGNMCTNVAYNPYSYMRFPVANQTETANKRTVTFRTGDRCDPAFQPGDPEYIVAGAAIDGTYTPNDVMQLLLGSATMMVENEADVCDYNFALADEDEDYPNCDIGDYRVRTITYSEEIIPATCNDEPYQGAAANCGICRGDSSITTQADCNAAFVAPNDWAGGAYVAESTACNTNVGTYDTKSCGGNANLCIGGNFPSVMEEDLFDRVRLNSGVSYSPILTGPPGVPPSPLSFSYTAPDSLGLDSNISIANFPKTNQCIDNANLPFTFFARDWERYSRSVRENFNADQTVRMTDAMMGNPSFIYACNDGTGIPQARIRLYVREWDQSFTSSSPIDRVNPAGNIMGGDDINDVPLPPPFDDRFTNEFISWRDINQIFNTVAQPMTLNLCEGNTATTPVPTAANRAQYFPLFLD